MIKIFWFIALNIFLVDFNDAFARSRFVPVAAKHPLPFEWKAQISFGSTIYCAQQWSSGSNISVYFSASECKKDWYSSIFGQVYTMFKGQMFCVTLPPSVFDKIYSWDYIELFPCALNIDEQKLYWSDNNQTFYSQKTINKTHFPLKEWEGYLYFASYLSAKKTITFSKSEPAFKYMQSSAKKLTVMLEMPKYLFRMDRFRAYFNFNKEDKNLFFYNKDTTAITCVSANKPAPKSVVLATNDGVECNKQSTKWNLIPSMARFTIPFTSKTTAMFHFVSNDGNYLGKKKDNADYYIINKDIVATPEIQNEYQISFKLDASARRIFDNQNLNTTLNGAPCPVVRTKKSVNFKRSLFELQHKNRQTPAPPSSAISEEWVQRIWQIVRTGEQGVFGICGLCFLQAVEAAIEFSYFVQAPAASDRRGHFFSVTGPRLNPDGSYSRIPLDFSGRMPVVAQQLERLIMRPRPAALGVQDQMYEDTQDALRTLFPSRTITTVTDIRVAGTIGLYQLVNEMFLNLEDGDVALVSLAFQSTHIVTGDTQTHGHALLIVREDNDVSADYVNLFHTNIEPALSYDDYLHHSGPYPFSAAGIREIVQQLNALRPYGDDANYRSEFTQGLVNTISHTSLSSSESGSDDTSSDENDEDLARVNQVPAVSYHGCDYEISPYVAAGAVGGATNNTNFCLDSNGAPILCTDADESDDPVRGLGAVTPTAGSPGTEKFQWNVRWKDDFRRSLANNRNTSTAILYNLSEPNFSGEELYSGQFNGEQWGLQRHLDGSVSISSEDTGQCLFPLGYKEGSNIGLKPCHLVSATWQLSTPTNNGEVMIGTSPIPFSSQQLCITTSAANSAYQLYSCIPNNKHQYFKFNEIKPVLVSSKANGYYLQSRKDKSSLEPLVYFAKNGAKPHKKWEVMVNYYQDAFMLKNVSTDLCLSAIEAPQAPDYQSIEMSHCDHYQFLQAWRVHKREGSFVQIKNAGLGKMCLAQAEGRNKENQAQLKPCQDTQWQAFKITESSEEYIDNAADTFPIPGVEKAPVNPHCK